MKRRIFSVMFALVLALSLSLITAVPVAADDAYEPVIGWWQSSDPASGVAEFSTAQFHSADYSAHLEAYVAESPGDYHEAYVANPTGVELLADLTDVSFWYYCPLGNNAVAPLIDVWLDTNDSYSSEFPPAGDEEWLLGMLADVTVFDTWVEITADDITWVRATGGTVYGVGSEGLAAAKAEADSGVYATLGDCPVLAIGVETGGPGTYISSRSYDMDFYVDDVAVNGVTYAMDPRVVNETQTKGYVTIQEAIDAADPGDTILVSDGTYPEHLIVDIANLTIKSVSGDAAIVLQVVDNQGMKIAAAADGFTLGGEEGHGFTITGDGGRLIELENGPSGVEISHNTIDTTGAPTMGLSVGAGGATDLAVSNNTFTADDGDGSIWGPDMVNVAVSSNIFTGPTSPASGYAVQFSGVTGTSTISANEISNYAMGVFVFGAAPSCGTTAVSGLTISGNTISGCIKGIRLGHSSQTSAVDVTVIGNNISGCGKGIDFAADGTHADMESNTFTDNTYNIYHAAEIMAGGSDFYGNINDAMEAADPGDTINVYAGTYTESLYIDFSITIQSEEGAIITAGGEWEPVTYLDGYVEIELGWDDEEPAGPLAETAVFDGFYISEEEPIYLYEVNNGSSLTISNNVLEYYSVGIFSDGYTVDNASSVTIEGNYLFGPQEVSSGICFNAVVGGSELTIRDNWIFWNYEGIYIGDVDEASTVTIEDNKVAENYVAIYFDGVDESTVTIVGNTIGEWYCEEWDYDFEGNYDGIEFEPVYESTIAILNNDILENQGETSGIHFWYIDEYTTVDIHFNSIVGNGEYGVYNNSEYSIDATCNWWGDVAGPDYWSNPYYPTDGDSLYGDVDYIPWMIQSELSADWNIWSRPIAPDPASWAQLQAELVEDDIVNIYYFDTSTQYWGTDPDDAGPLDAFYIQMPAESRIRYYFDDEATFPGVKDMKVGWNFIGLTELYDMALTGALQDAYWGTGQTELIGYNKVISPFLNENSWSYLRPVGIGSVPLLHPTEGYWVFMVNDGVLGGFTTTPIVEVENGP